MFFLTIKWSKKKLLKDMGYWPLRIVHLMVLLIAGKFFLSVLYMFAEPQSIAEILLFFFRFFFKDSL